MDVERERVEEEISAENTTEDTNILSKNNDGDCERIIDLNCCDTRFNKEKDVSSSFLKDTSGTHQVRRKIGHRRVHSDGGISYKKINTSQIMESIQLGVQMSAGALSAQPERDVLMADFMTVESTPFTLETSTDRKPEFIFKTYAPVAFRHLRDLFGIVPDHFAASFRQAPLLELANAGASGSIFYLTPNDNFIIKTVQYREAQFLQKLLPGYFLNLSQNPRTLLPKFVGLYCYKRNAKNVRLVVMNNVLPSAIMIHQKYDLKGSTYMRKASKMELRNNSPTYKDLDFMQNHPEGIYLGADEYKNLMQTIQRDCRVLESFRIMDYSLLLGIHYEQNNNLRDCVYSKIKEEENIANENIGIQFGGDGNYAPYHVDQDTSNATETTGNNAIHCSSESISDKRQKERRDMQINVTPNGIPAQKANGEKLLLFVGIIDILQSYRFKKKAEHFLKSIVHESDEISVHNPTFYAHRFEEFLVNKVFKVLPTSPKSKRKNALVPFHTK